MQTKKIGFIGLGNMATAMIGGMLQKGVVAPENLIGSARTAATCRRVAEQYSIITYPSNVEVAAQADILFLAVKPQFFREVIGEIRDTVPSGKYRGGQDSGRDCRAVRRRAENPALYAQYPGAGAGGLHRRVRQ